MRLRVASSSSEAVDPCGSPRRAAVAAAEDRRTSSFLASTSPEDEINHRVARNSMNVQFSHRILLPPSPATLRSDMEDETLAPCLRTKAGTDGREKSGQGFLSVLLNGPLGRLWAISLRSPAEEGRAAL